MTVVSVSVSFISPKDSFIFYDMRRHNAFINWVGVFNEEIENAFKATI